MRETRAEVERMLDQCSSEIQVMAALQNDEDGAEFAAYESATIKRVARNLRVAAAELDQLHPETDTPPERRERTSGCLRKLRESEWILGNMDRRA